MRVYRWLIVLTACVLVLVALAGFKYTRIQAAIAFGESFPEPSESVLAETVQKGQNRHHVSTIGELVAPEQMMLRNELAGRITMIDMVSGQTVEKGQVLIQQDTADDRARLQAASANARLAEIKLARLQRLLKNNTTSQDSVDQAVAERDIAMATVDELQAMIAKKTLSAPFHARVGLHQLEVGEYLDANSALVELVGTSANLWVDFHLPLAQGSVTVGDVVTVVLPGAASDPLSARVIARSPALSAQSRNLRYRAQIDRAPDIPANAVVTVEVLLQGDEGLHVPTSAVLRDELGSYVFRLVADSTGPGYRAQRQPVTLGREADQRVVVEQGLEPGVLIAADGSFKLRHGMLAYIRSRSSETTPSVNVAQEQGNE